MCRNGTNAAGMQTLAGGAVPLGTNVTSEPRFRTIGRAGRASAISPAGAFSPMKPGRASRMNSETKHWQSIDTAPADRDILIYVAAWGPLIARPQFRVWRMDVAHAVPG